jgi:hypothetical protein
MTRAKKPKAQIKRTKTSLGWPYRIYVDGMYVGTGLTRAQAREGAKRMLVINELPPSRARRSKQKQPAQLH